MIKFLSTIIIFWGITAITYIEKASAQSTFYYYKQLGIKEGLSQSRVQCILNDHKGYLWIGTGVGLNCYDRDHLKQYLHHSGDEKSLPSNDILFIAEDSLLNLWVATRTGLCIYDRTNDCFNRPVINKNKNTFISSYVSLDDGIIFGAAGIIYKYDYATQQWHTLYNQSSGPFITFKKMLKYDENHILINTQWYGIYLFDLRTNQIKKIDAFPDKNYNSIYIDSHQRLWVSAYGDGLYCYQNDKQLKHFTSSNSQLTYNVILDIAEKDNQLWIATDGGGINILSLDDFSFSNIQQQQDDVHSFPANAIYRLYRDPADNIWAGSIRQGLIGIKKVYARSFQNVPFGNRYGLSNQTINRISQDSEGVVWIGTDGGGINSFDLSTTTFKHYPSTRNKKVVSIIEYSSHELMFYSFNEGLFILDKRSGQIRPFMLVNKEVNEEMCLNGYSVNIKRLPNNKLIFSSQQIFSYDTKTHKFEKIATVGQEYVRNSPIVIGTKDHNIYFLDLKNICEYDSSRKTFKTIYEGDIILNDGCIDNEGNFWLASTDGLISYNPQTKKVEPIQTPLFNEATSVTVDNQHRVWVGTRQYLYIYHQQMKNFIRLDEIDGVLPNEYLMQATLVSPKGMVIFGGVAGMTIIDTQIRFNQKEGHKIEVLDILMNGRPVPLNEEIQGTVETIEVPWNFSSLQLKVLLNEKDVFRKNMFRFHIKGLKEKTVLSNNNSFVINYLPTGDYTIMASYYTKTGAWSKEQSVIRIIVTAPWWQTIWFYAICCLFIGTMTFYVSYVIHRKRRAKHKREIHKLKNRMYEEKINFLTNISHELRTPLTLICAPLKRIINHEVATENIDTQLTSIYKQADQMRNIIDMVLDVRKLEEGKDILCIVSQSLNNWVRSVGDKFLSEYENKGIELVYQLDENITDIPFDKNKCEFVLSNFLMNALKFSEAGTKTTITTELSQERDSVRVAVKDQGMGLNMVDPESLFTNFYQGEHSKGGSGIGLSYSKSIITHHKGKIGALENTDQGATFYFELPLFVKESISSQAIIDKGTSETTVKKMNEIDYSFLKNYSVMIVEDTADLRSYLKDTLSQYFAKVYAAKDGKEGLEQIESKLPDIIISDVMMPRMNGFELCQTVKNNLNISHIPFILLTAYHNSQNMYTGYKTGADAFLPKPFEVDGLVSLIYNQLKLREQIKARYNEDKIPTSYKDISFSNADETFLQKLNTLICENINNPELDVAFLATNMCISRSLLFNKVKALTEMGIIDYVNKIRIDNAAILLTTSSMNLTEISEMVGFSSLRYFSKVFKAVKGETPSTYKKQREA